MFDTGSRYKKGLLNISQLAHNFTPLYCKVLLNLHVFSRCDTASAFKGTGKVKPMKLLQKKPRHQVVFQNLKIMECVKRPFSSTGRINSMHKLRGSHLSVNDLCIEMVLKKCCGKEKQLNSKKNTNCHPFDPIESV